jgi:hypothetical protein
LVIYYIVGDRDFYYAPHGPAALVWRGWLGQHHLAQRVVARLDGPPHYHLPHHHHAAIPHHSILPPHCWTGIIKHEIAIK